MLQNIMLLNTRSDVHSIHVPTYDYMHEELCMSMFACVYTSTYTSCLHKRANTLEYIFVRYATSYVYIHVFHACHGCYTIACMSVCYVTTCACLKYLCMLYLCYSIQASQGVQLTTPRLLFIYISHYLFIYFIIA